MYPAHIRETGERQTVREHCRNTAALAANALRPLGLEKSAYLAGLLGCGADAVYETLEDLLNKILPKKALREYGTKREDLPEWAKSVIDNQQRLLKNSFIPMTEELVLKIYQDLY